MDVLISYSLMYAFFGFFFTSSSAAVMRQWFETTPSCYINWDGIAILMIAITVLVMLGIFFLAAFLLALDCLMMDCILP